MLLRVLLSGSSPTEIIQALVFGIVAILAAISVHEFAHAFVAYKMGDYSQKNMGRLSLNPLNHINPIGLIMLLLLGFGWANPVMISPRNFKHQRLGIIFTSAAGPLMNFIVSFLSLLIRTICVIFYYKNGNMILFNVCTLFEYLAIYNASLGLFNLIPIPPLDGSKILAELLPYKARIKYYSIERYSLYIFIALIILLNRTSILTYMMNGLFDFFFLLIEPIIKLIL